MKYGICYHANGVLIERLPDSLGIGYTADELLAKIRDELEAVERSIQARDEIEDAA